MNYGTSPEQSPTKAVQSNPINNLTHIGSNSSLNNIKNSQSDRLNERTNEKVIPATSRNSYKEPNSNSSAPNAWNKDSTLFNKDIFKVKAMGSMGRSISFPDKINTESDCDDDLDPGRFNYSPSAPGYFDNLVEILHMSKMSGGTPS